MDGRAVIAKMLLEMAIRMAEERAGQANTDERGNHDDSMEMAKVSGMSQCVRRRTTDTRENTEPM